MKTVLIVIGRLTVGGAERVGFQIGKLADPRQFQIDYLVFGPEQGAYEAPLLEKGCRIWHLDPPAADHRAFLRALEGLIREHHYDVVHSHTMFNSGLVLWTAKRCGVPIRIAHSHSIRSPGRRGLLKSAYERAMRRLIRRSATHFIGCGQAAGEWLYGADFFRKRGILLLNGIELERFRFDPARRAALRQTLGWEHSFVLGHAGHLAPVKNQAFLIRLMPELLKRRPETKLLLLGEGDDRPMLEALVRELALEQSVLLPGSVSNVNEYLNALDLFLFPSLYEGMPLSILEAQANGLPCLLSDQVPRDVFLTDLPRALPLEAPSAWIDAALEARRDDRPARYADQLAAQGFDVASMTEALYQIYAGG